MIHRDLKRYCSIALDQQRQKAVQSIERKQPFQRRTLERADGATGVSKIRFQNSLTHPARDIRRGAPHKVVLARQPHAANEIHPLKLGDEFWQVGRIVLQITRSEEHTSELQSRLHLVCRLLLEKKK